MKSDIEIRDFVRQLLLSCQVYGAHQINPFTGGSYMKGSDPIRVQVDKAFIRVKAMVEFGRSGPGGRRLPLNYNEREDLKATGNPDCVLFALWARSLDAHKFNLATHPAFEVYAAGFLSLDTPYREMMLASDPTVIRRYPPQPLEGLSKDSYWN
jgi:hypothetical protein